jgi:flavin-dependent dehydrogenase
MSKQQSEFRRRYDAVVVGARCAGAATAMLLARQGLDVLVVDKAQYGSDTLSTHALMRGAVMQLHHWGVLEAVKAAGTAPVRKTSFQYGDECLEVPIKESYGVDALYAPRRKVLDRILVDAGREAGAVFRFGCIVDGLTRNGDGTVTGITMRNANGHAERIAADIVIGADGTRSIVARETQAETLVEGMHAAAVVYGYFRGIEDDGYRWGFGRQVTSGVIPTNDGATLVFAGVPKALYCGTFAGKIPQGFMNVLDSLSPHLVRQVANAEQLGRLQGFTGLPGFMRQPFGPGWALVGDAGYFRDPITAHGITDALRDAELLARAVIGDDGFGFAEYRYFRDAVSRPLFDVTEAIAACDWSLDDVKQHHVALNEAMKVETAFIDRLHARRPLPNRGREGRIQIVGPINAAA